MSLLCASSWHHGFGSARWCVLGGAAGAVFTGGAKMCADPPTRMPVCAARMAPPSATTTAVGVIFMVVHSVPLGCVSQPQAVPGLSAPQRERTKTEAATAFALLPRAPRPTKGRYKPFEYSPQRTPSGTFEPPDLMLTWGGRTPSHRRLNTRRRHYFGSGAFCCDLLPAPVHTKELKGSSAPRFDVSILQIVKSAGSADGQVIF